MVISMDRNKFFWNTSFPSLTVCPHKRIDDAKLHEYMKARPQIFKSDDDRNEFTDFIEKLSNATFENYDQLPMNRTFEIDSSQYMDLLWNLSFVFKPELNSGSTNKLYLQNTITELGICYAVNSKVAVYNSYRYWQNNRWDFVKTNDTTLVTVHPLDGEIYAQIINLSCAYEVYFHGYHEVPDISKQRYSFPAGDYTTVELLALEILTSNDAKALSISQRQCRFAHESDILETSPIYSFNLCQNECRLRLALRTCGCVPHFYRSRTKYGKKYRVCDFEGIRCLQTIKDVLISLKSKIINIDCDCYANCDDPNFFVKAYRSRAWFLGSNLQWGISEYPKMQLKREVIFSMTDFLVYIGGMAALFLGCSLLSFTELAYYLTYRFCLGFCRSFWRK
ncbi:pickpocket protein 11 [Contarinia nasturtii]|uniref:pickpocket protein 11 n=1 Tax=Contarinia nasturtii TaxID=265458 RepID=UPI0012D37BF9|nr:pickpocket protein 11 [Contarinia nasturtii]